MNFEKIVTSKEYKDIISTHVKFKKLTFLNNDSNEKNNLCKNVKNNNNQNTINDSFLFMKDKDSYFFLLKNKNNTFDGTVFLVKSGSITFIGNNPFDFITDRENPVLNVQYINREGIIAESQKNIGFFNWYIDSTKLNASIKAYS